MQHHRVHVAEKRGVDADAYGQTQHSGSGEARRLPQLADCVLNILKQVLEQGSHESLRAGWRFVAETLPPVSAFFRPIRSTENHLKANILA
jgi:hypothetical protein